MQQHLPINPLYREAVMGLRQFIKYNIIKASQFRLRAPHFTLPTPIISLLPSNASKPQTKDQTTDSKDQRSHAHLHGLFVGHRRVRERARRLVHGRHLEEIKDQTTTIRDQTTLTVLSN